MYVLSRESGWTAEITPGPEEHVHRRIICREAAPVFGMRGLMAACDVVALGWKRKAGGAGEWLI